MMHDGWGSRRTFWLQVVERMWNINKMFVNQVFSALVLSCLMSLPAFAHDAQATVRITVQAAGVPVPAATVRLDNLTMQTDRTGTAVATVSRGRVEVRVSKEGFLPATAVISVDEDREFQV